MGTTTMTEAEKNTLKRLQEVARQFIGRIETLLTEPSGDVHADILAAMKRENPDVDVKWVNSGASSSEDGPLPDAATSTTTMNPSD